MPFGLLAFNLALAINYLQGLLLKHLEPYPSLPSFVDRSGDPGTKTSVIYPSLRRWILIVRGHSRISDNDLLKQILYHFCASHIPKNKLQHVCYSELLSNDSHDATSMVARHQKIAG